MHRITLNKNVMLDDIKKTLWATADKPRTNMDAAEYKHLVLGLNGNSRYAIDAFKQGLPDPGRHD